MGGASLSFSTASADTGSGTQSPGGGGAPSPEKGLFVQTNRADIKGVMVFNDTIG